MTESEILMSQRQTLVDQLSGLNADLSAAKVGKRRPIRQAIRKIEHSIKDIDQALKKSQKFDYLQAGVENGIDVRGNVVKGIGEAVSSVASSAATVMSSEFGMFGKGKVGKAEQDRLAKQPNQTNISNPFGGMDQKTIMMIVGGAAVLMLLMFKKR